jgi:hypothetical protein
MFEFLREIYFFVEFYIPLNITLEVFIIVIFVVILSALVVWLAACCRNLFMDELVIVKNLVLCQLGDLVELLHVSDLAHFSFDLLFNNLELVKIVG